MKNKKLLRELILCIGITFGAFIAGLSYNLFILPNGIAPAGVSGIAAIVTRFTGWNLGLLIILINIPLYIISWKQLGLDFGCKSLLGTVVMSLTIDYIPVKPIIENEPLLGAVFGGIMLGAGLGIAFRFTGSTGGTDILAKLISSRFPTISIGNCVMLLDVIIIIANGFTTGKGTDGSLTVSANVILYSLIAMYIDGVVIDFIENGSKSGKAYYVISDKADIIATRINNELSRGVTKVRAVGTYTQEEHPLLICLCLRHETVKLRRIVKEEDPKAIMYLIDAREITGLGFNAEDRNIV